MLLTVSHSNDGRTTTATMTTLQPMRSDAKASKTEKQNKELQINGFRTESEKNSNKRKKKKQAGLRAQSSCKKIAWNKDYFA